MKLTVRVLLFVALSTITSGRSQTPALLLYGGDDHQTFLGCVNCSKFEADSICNQFGRFGSEFQGDSIWNMFGTYGSKFNASSPWNQFSQGSVAIVGIGNGGLRSFAPANKLANKRTTIAAFNQLADSAAESSELTTVRNLFCGL